MMKGYRLSGNQKVNGDINKLIQMSWVTYLDLTWSQGPQGSLRLQVTNMVGPENAMTLLKEKKSLLSPT